MGVRSRSTAKGAQFGLSVTSSPAVSLTVPKAAMAAEIYVRTAAVVFTRDGTTATSTLGFQANATDMIRLNSRDELDRFSVIAVSSTATLDVEYFTEVSDTNTVTRI